MRVATIFLPIALIGMFSVFGVRTFSNATCCAADNSQQEAKPTGDSSKNAPAFACSLTALTAQQRKRHAELRKALRESVKEIQELPDGYAFRLPDDTKTILAAGEFITYEKLCCPFFKFNLEVESDGKPAWLKLTGREGVKQFLKIEFDIKKIKPISVEETKKIEKEKFEEAKQKMESMQERGFKLKISVKHGNSIEK